MPNKNLHTLDLSLQSAKKDDLPYLGDITVVHELVGVLASESLEHLAGLSNGELTSEQLSERNLAGALALARVFLGHEHSYNLVPNWNQPGKIDAFVAQESEISEEDPDKRLATLFLLMIQDMYAAAQMVDEGKTENDVRTAIDGSLETITAVLLGISFEQLEAEGLAYRGLELNPAMPKP